MKYPAKYNYNDCLIDIVNFENCNVFVANSDASMATYKEFEKQLDYDVYVDIEDLILDTMKLSDYLDLNDYAEKCEKGDWQIVVEYTDIIECREDKLVPIEFESYYEKDLIGKEILHINFKIKKWR